jgi:hypothetical protein
MEGLAIYLVIWLICGIVAAAIASGKGRNVAGWFFGGFFGGLIGIIVIACISNLKQERAYREQLESEQRRLREQLRQERIKAESLRQFTAVRLDTHDRILGVDTRSGLALPAAGGVQQLPGGGDGGPSAPLTPEEALARMAGAPPVQAVPPVQMIPPVQEFVWYYEVAGAPIGPVGELDIRRLIHEGRINARTLLWCEDMAQWTSAGSVDIFRSSEGLA